MKKVYKKLTQDQTKRGVIFSSCISTQRTELTDDTIHEVLMKDYNHNGAEGDLKIKRLLDDKFFNNSHYNYNIIRRN